MPRAFHFKGEHVLLTYAQSPDLDPMEVDRLVIRHGGQCIIGREPHKDGGIHFHCFVQFAAEFESRDPRCFDVGGRHPNFQKMYRTPQKGYDYAIKGGDVVGGTLERPSGGRVGSSSDKWAEIVASETREEFFANAARLDPKSLCCSFMGLTKYADWKYRVDRSPYSTPGGVSIVAESVPALVDWVRRNLERDQPGMFFHSLGILGGVSVYPRGYARPDPWRGGTPRSTPEGHDLLTYIRTPYESVLVR